MIPNTKKYTYKEFLEMTKDVEGAEFINGRIFYMAPSPSTEHQEISFRLLMELGDYFQDQACGVYHAPYDIVFENEDTGEKEIVQPDITIICDRSKLTPKHYKGVPAAVIEILSPATAAKDTIEKMNLYMRFGVKEYWIVKPKSKVVEIYTLEGEIYTEPTVYAKDDTVESYLFEGLRIQLEKIFRRNV